MGMWDTLDGTYSISGHIEVPQEIKVKITANVREDVSMSDEDSRILEDSVIDAVNRACINTGGYRCEILDGIIYDECDIDELYGDWGKGVYSVSIMFKTLVEIYASADLVDEYEDGFLFGTSIDDCQYENQFEVDKGLVKEEFKKLPYIGKYVTNASIVLQDIDMYDVVDALQRDL